MGIAGSLIDHFLRPKLPIRREIASDISITSEWLGLTLGRKVLSNRQFRSVDLIIGGLGRNEGVGEELRLADGILIEPEIQIRDAAGVWHDLERSITAVDYDIDSDSTQMTGARFFVCDSHCALAGTFLAIRVRSKNPFICKKIIWRAYNVK